MIPSPDLAALLADPAPQARAQAGLGTALDQWQSDAANHDALNALRGYALGRPLSDLPDLAILFGDDPAPALALVRPLVASFCRVLAENPFGIVPLRHHTDGVVSTLMLAQAADATLTLVAIGGHGLARRPAATSVCFSPAEEWEIVLAGRGSGRLIERVDSRLVAHRLDLLPGVALGREALREALLFDAVDGALLMLRLQRRESTPEPKREFSLATGELLRQASASPQESRNEMAVALLGRMGRTDAAPLLAEVARDCMHGDSLRWQALRECLALDSGTGFWTLTAIARAVSDPLAVPAGALRAQLLEAYPQLAEVEPCPA